MRIDISQQMRLDQRMKLAPRIIQAMEILQLPMLALQERIDQELEKNPVLELANAPTDDQAPPAEEEYPPDRGERALVVKDEDSHSEDFQRLAEFTDEFGSEPITGAAPEFYRAPVGLRDRKMDAMANTPALGESLNEHLLDQWAFVEAPEDVKSAGLEIINYIDSDGYLRTPLEEFLKNLKNAKKTENSENPENPILIETLNSALALVQTLLPTGVGARDMRECLLLQLNAEAAAGMEVELELELVNNFLHEIEMNRLPQIAKRAGKSIEQIKEAIGNLSHLNPRPGTLIGRWTTPGITPEIIVDVDSEGNVVIKMDDGNSPNLRISRSYRKLARQRETDREAKQFLRNNIRSAQWLMSAIAQRRNTVYRVAGEVFKVQRDFLDKGTEALKPLPMADVANKVHVHVATVSRAVSGKYVQTPRGIYPLRMFFSGGTKTSEGHDVAWDAVKVKLKEVVEAEDKSKPLNDDALAEELKSHGLNIARRTVAKYRKILNIPPARKRRQY